MALRHWLQLSLADGIGPILARRLVEATGSVEAACTANSQTLKEIERIGSKAQQIAASLRAAEANVEVEIQKAQAVDAHIICSDDAEYPILIKSIPDPPLVLYVKGNLEARDLIAVGIVGSRRCSHYGREQSERFGALLAGAGITVVSGGARGIDSAAHRGALMHPMGRTLAILGCGVNVDYPSENAALFQQIAGRGAVISEYPIDTPPTPENFPRRNRIISGLSRGVLVIEADTRSGALITARQAGVEQGRPVFALPGRVDNAMSAGPHQLIRDGATLVTSLEDILEGMGPLPQQAVETHGAAPASSDAIAAHGDAAITLSDQQQLILSHLSGEASAVDRIIELSGLDAPVVMRELTFLCLKGAVRRMDGQTFVRGSRMR